MFACQFQHRRTLRLEQSNLLTPHLRSKKQIPKIQDILRIQYMIQLMILNLRLVFNHILYSEMPCLFGICFLLDFFILSAGHGVRK